MSLEAFQRSTLNPFIHKLNDRIFVDNKRSYRGVTWRLECNTHVKASGFCLNKIEPSNFCFYETESEINWKLNKKPHLKIYISFFHQLITNAVDDLWRINYTNVVVHCLISFSPELFVKGAMELQRQGTFLILVINKTINKRVSANPLLNDGEGSPKYI